MCTYVKSLEYPEFKRSTKNIHAYSMRIISKGAIRSAGMPYEWEIDKLMDAGFNPTNHIVVNMNNTNLFIKPAEELEHLYKNLQPGDWVIESGVFHLFQNIEDAKRLYEYNITTFKDKINKTACLCEHVIPKGIEYIEGYSIYTKLTPSLVSVIGAKSCILRRVLDTCTLKAVYKY